MEVIPKGGFDPTKVSFTPKWFIAAICAVVLILAVVSVGTWGYGKLSDMLPTKLDAEGAW